MQERKKLPEPLRIQIDALLREAGLAERKRDFTKCEELQLKAWDLLPEPKLSWDFYSNIMPRDNLLFYRDTQQFDKAQHWLDITRKSYGPGRDDSVEFFAATLWLEMGENNKAFDEFDRQYKALKKRPFEGKDPKYLAFYLSRKVKHD